MSNLPIGLFPPLGSGSGARPAGAADKAKAKDPQDEKLRETAREFEAVFLGVLLQEMRKSTRSLSAQKPSFARETYEGWQDEMSAKSMASGRGVGLAEILYRQMLQSK